MTRLLIVSMAAVLWGFMHTAFADDKAEREPSVTVAGTGEVSAAPDLAQINVGVVTQATVAAAALKDNNAAVEKLFKAIAAQGIAKKDVQTSALNVLPQYRQGRQGQRMSEIIGYEVTNQVHLKVRKISTLGSVLDELVRSGANQVHGISFSIADPAPLMDRARTKAYADARRKATLYAKEAGVNLGRVLMISEGSAHVPRPMFFGRDAVAAAVPVAPGEQELHVSVTVTFALK